MFLSLRDGEVKIPEFSEALVSHQHYFLQLKHLYDLQEVTFAMLYVVSIVNKENVIINF
jgi:hypothetical protein